MKGIKIWKGWNVNIDGEVTFCDSPSKVWELFGWNISENEEASKCADIITREMYCFGHMDISALTDYKHSIVLDVVPCESEVEA